MIRFAFTVDMTTVDIFSVFQNEPKVWILRFPTSTHDYPKPSCKILIITLFTVVSIPNYIYANLLIEGQPTLCATELFAFSTFLIFNSILLATLLGSYYLVSRFQIFQNITRIDELNKRMEKELKIHQSFGTEQKQMNNGLAIISLAWVLLLIYSLLVQVPKEMVRGFRNLVVFFGALMFNITAFWWVNLCILVKCILLNIENKQVFGLRNSDMQQTRMFRKIFFQVFLEIIILNDVYELLVLYTVFYGLGHSVMIIYGMLLPARSCFMKNYSFEMLICLGFILVIRFNEEKILRNVSMHQKF